MNSLIAYLQLINPKIKCKRSKESNKIWAAQLDPKSAVPINSAMAHAFVYYMLKTTGRKKRSHASLHKTHSYGQSKVLLLTWDWVLLPGEYQLRGTTRGYEAIVVKAKGANHEKCELSISKIQ